MNLKHYFVFICFAVPCLLRAASAVQFTDCCDTRSAKAAATPHRAKHYPADVRAALPSFDWREYGINPHIYDQGNIGSSTIFSVLGSIELAAAVHVFKKTLKNGTLVPHLSSAQLEDCDLFSCCSGIPKNQCNAHNTLPACGFNKMAKIGGAASASSYPSPRNKCAPVAVPKVTLASSACAQTNATGQVDEIEMRRLIASSGPANVCLDSQWMAFYSSGITNPTSCSAANIDHCVYLMGWGTENGVDYWTGVNSFGASWGERGFFRIARNNRNVCGLQSIVSTPLVSSVH